MIDEAYENYFHFERAIREEYERLGCPPLSHVLSFLSLALSGTAAERGYSLEFFDKTLQRMRVKFIEKSQEFKNIKDE
jgi:hypothetical protein